MVLRAFLHLFGVRTRAPPPDTCQLPGCSKPCFVEASGRVHGFCNRTHAKQGLSQSRRASTAAAAEFDGTREYVTRDLVLFWQPPSMFSQWTPSTFSVDDVRGWLQLQHTDTHIKSRSLLVDYCTCGTILGARRLELGKPCDATEEQLKASPTAE